MATEGILARRLGEHPHLRSMRLAARVLIEEDVCRRLYFHSDSPQLGILHLDSTVIDCDQRSGGDVALITTPAGEILRYLLKQRHDYGEPLHATYASEQEIGPKVYGTFIDDAWRAEILEEFYPQELCIEHNRTPLTAPALAKLFLGFVLPKGGFVIHRDERARHTFILGAEETVSIRLIDWGGARFFGQRQTVGEWVAHQLGWFRSVLGPNISSTTIWRDFFDLIAANVKLQQLGYTEKIVAALPQIKTLASC